MSSAPDCRDAAGFLLQLVHSLPGRGQAADAVKDGELCRCCPATCVGQSFNDLRPHKIFTYTTISLARAELAQRVGNSNQLEL